jgi:hypothetical protein
MLHPAKRGKIRFLILILHGSEAFICKAFKAEAIVHYAFALITQQMEASGPPARVKINEIK